MSTAPAILPRLAVRWHSFEAWVGSRASAAALFVVALGAFAVQSAFLPVHPGRDMSRYVQTYVQLWYDDAVLPSVLNTRGPLAALGTSLPLELGGWAAEIWLAVLYAASIVVWAAVAFVFGARAAVLTAGLLLVYPGYAILFHGLASDALFAAGFAGWALVLSRAILAPSVPGFLLAGLTMGALVLIRPSNQVFVVMVLLPLLLRAPWRRRFSWVAAFFLAWAVTTESWKLVAGMLWGDAVWLEPSRAVLAAALGLSVLLLPVRSGRTLALVAVPVVLVLVVAWGLSDPHPIRLVRSVAQAPSTDVFLFRAFMIDPIISPTNGPESRELGRAVERDLLAHEPYRSYEIGTEEFFASGSDRMFSDLKSLAASVDLAAVTDEAIRRRPGQFAEGIARTFWQQLWSSRVYASGAPARSEEVGESTPATEGGKLPRPSEGEPIPAARVGPDIYTLGGDAYEVWTSPTEHHLVFDDPNDEARYARFERDTERLARRIPTHDGNETLVHRFNQASKAFPPLVLWIVVGLVAIALRRPKHALVVLAPAAAGFVLIAATAAVALPVPEYAAPVGPAFIALAAAGLLGRRERVS